MATNFIVLLGSLTEEMEWKMVAEVLDRTFFVVYFMIILITTLALFYPITLIHKLEDSLVNGTGIWYLSVIIGVINVSSAYCVMFTFGGQHLMISYHPYLGSPGVVQCKRPVPAHSASVGYTSCLGFKKKKLFQEKIEFFSLENTPYFSIQ